MLSAPVSLENGEELTIRVPIAANGFPRHSIGVLEHVRPKAGGSPPARDRRASALDAFEARRISGTGLHFDRKQLAKASVSTLGEFLQNVSGLDVVDPASATSMQMSRSAGLTNLGARVQGAPTCHVGWFLDGHRIDLPGQSDPYTDSLALMELDALEAIEVFRGLSEMPLEFAEPDLRCGAIALWTRT